MYTAALRYHRFEVVAVEDGLQALRWLEQSRPSIIVLDLSLPRLDGRDVYREVHSHADMRDIPIVIVTGQDASDMNGSDIACVLQKPVTGEALVIAVERCLRQAPAG
jgi:DNA-binding response OmpR family regulator